MISSPPPSGAEKARLLRRTQAVARLRHPNLVRMLPLPGGAGLSPILGDAKRLSDFTLPAGTFKRFDLEQVVRLLLDVLSGLGALHEVVVDGQAFGHGEVCPQNIYIDEHGTARLVPLMNGHLLSGAKPEHTGYAAPERLNGPSWDARADVFSVGAMLWEALSGQRLHAETMTKAPQIQLGPRTRWAQPLCAIAERAIAQDPARRFSNALEMSHAIATAAAKQLARVNVDAWQEEAPTPVFQPQLHLLRASTPPPAVVSIAPPATIAPPSVETAPPTVDSDVEVTFDEPSRRRGRGALYGMVVVALAGLGVGFQRLPGDLRARITAPIVALTYRAPASAAATLKAPALAAAQPVAVTAPPVVSAAAVATATPDTAAALPAAASQTEPSVVAPPAASAKTNTGKASVAPERPAPARPNKPTSAPAAPAGAAKTLIRHIDDYGI